MFCVARITAVNRDATNSKETVRLIMKTHYLMLKCHD